MPGHAKLEGHGNMNITLTVAIHMFVTMWGRQFFLTWYYRQYTERIDNNRLLTFFSLLTRRRRRRRRTGHRDAPCIVTIPPGVTYGFGVQSPSTRYPMVHVVKMFIHVSPIKSHHCQFLSDHNKICPTPQRAISTSLALFVYHLFMHSRLT